jgi:hypothetical protein
VWRSESATYRAAMLQTINAIEQGTITTPDQANIELASAKASIRNLTDTAIDAARTKDTAARSKSTVLSASIASNMRILVLIGLVGLVLYAVRHNG